MLKRCLCWIALLAWLLSPARTSAAHYEIIFEEGAITYDANSTAEDINNKYLAHVTVKKDGTTLVKDLRGSTLPDAWAFYRRWNVELKHSAPPNDADVVSIFEQFAEQTAQLRASRAKLGATALADLADILDVLNRIPVLQSGTYPFVMGIHKSGRSPYGKPYVPRLLGGTADSPYDPAASKGVSSTAGGFIRTLNKNNAQGQRKIANGVNVHNGRSSQDYKDSEGCLTIHPQDWRSFYTVLPSPEDWAKQRHTGAVSVHRGKSLDSNAPHAPTILGVTPQ